MTSAPPNQSTISNLLSTHRALVDTLCSFLTVATHHILFLRRIYPPVSFLVTRAYNYPVRQNRHPDVCSWIEDAISAIRNQLTKNTVETIAVCIFECDNNQVLERWSFDLRSLPAVGKRDRDVPFNDYEEDRDLQRKINVTDLEASFRANLSRLSSTSAKIRPLPEGPDAPECSFTITIDVKDGSDRPVGRLEEEERAWIVAEPDSFETNLQPMADDGRNDLSHSGKTHAVRRLEAGELRMETFVEESAAKFAYPSDFKTTLERAKEMSYGAGTEKFDPNYGYDLEEPDINRKPNGGAYTDYQRG